MKSFRKGVCVILKQRLRHSRYYLNLHLQKVVRSIPYYVEMVGELPHNNTTCRQINIHYHNYHSSGHYPSSCVLHKTRRFGD
jgi:hypothetical protein